MPMTIVGIFIAIYLLKSFGLIENKIKQTKIKMLRPNSLARFEFFTH